MKNEYKRLDVFRCVHESHRGFGKQISVYHILKEKKCFPDGCFYFRWQCKMLSKRGKCHRGFSHVGRKCFSCPQFFEEKIHNRPELQIDPAGYREFRRELEQFEDWLQEHRHREMEFAGKVEGVKPHFVRKQYPKNSFLSFRGFLVSFREVFLGCDRVEDLVYLLLSAKYYRQLQLGQGDSIEGSARLETRHGRLLLNRPRRIEIISRGKPAVWDEAGVALAREAAVEFPTQPEECVQCPFGVLVDVQYMYDVKNARRRQLICLKGMHNERDCYIPREYCGLDAEAKAVLPLKD